MSLLARLRGHHAPDVEALSALADGRLDGDAMRALEEHVAGCAACAARLEELRSVKRMLAAVPAAEAPRSFRLRAANVGSARAAHRPASQPLRWAPALSGVAAVLFVAVLAADLSSNSGSSDARIRSEAVPEQAAAGRVEEQYFDAGDAAADGDSGAGTMTEAIATAAPTAAMLRDIRPWQANACQADATTPGATDSTLSNCLPASPPQAPAGSELDSGDTAAAPAPRTVSPESQIEATSSIDQADDNGGNRTAFWIVEVTAAAVAVGGAAAYIITRKRRSEVLP
jgi:hypothetical protein